MAVHSRPQCDPTRSRVLIRAAHPPMAVTHRTAFLAFAVLMAMLLLGLRMAHAGVALSVTVAPPPLPVYEQPVIPGPGYIWVPGYWSYGDMGYFWVPGTWVLPPDPDLLWTPGYWGFTDGAYAWNPGYWAPVVGFYGGIDYGYGYPGRGYHGGYWRDNRFYYNRSVNNISNVNVTNVYNETVVNRTTVNTVSYNGGPGGASARPTAQEQSSGRQARHGPTSAQMQHVSVASKEHGLLASVNHGHPEVAATAKPGAISGPAVVHARGAPAPSGTKSGTTAARPPAGEPRHGANQSESAQSARETPRQEARPQATSEPPRRLAEAPKTPERPTHPAPAEQHAAPAEQHAGRAAPERPAPPAERTPPPHERAAPAPERSERAAPAPHTAPAQPRNEPKREEPKRESQPPPHRSEDHGN